MQTQTEAEPTFGHNGGPTLDDDTYLNSRETKIHCGNVSDMCIWRWQHDERVGFPRPIQINRRNYWRVGDLRAWKRKHSTKASA